MALSTRATQAAQVMPFTGISALATTGSYPASATRFRTSFRSTPSFRRRKASWVVRLTRASSTPSARFSARSTRATQLAQVIPLMPRRTSFI
jgi:hypothetical protein